MARHAEELRPVESATLVTNSIPEIVLQRPPRIETRRVDNLVKAPHVVKREVPQEMPQVQHAKRAYEVKHGLVGTSRAQVRGATVPSFIVVVGARPACLRCGFDSDSGFGCGSDSGSGPGSDPGSG